MKAIVFRQDSAVQIETLREPAPGPGEVLVRVRASGICHTDVEILRGNYGSSAFPLVPGHEFAGEVTALGEGVTGVHLGDRIAVDPNLGCGACPACLQGKVNLCGKLGAYGVTRHGGFAEACVVAANAVLPIGTLDWHVAALAEPLGCVLNGLSPLGGRKVDNALLFGCGPIGILMALALKWRGVRDIAVVDLSDDRLALAESFGFIPLAAGSAAVTARHRQQDLAIDATGVPAVAEQLTDHVCDGGAALFFGVCPQSARIQLSPFELFRRQLSLFGTHSLNRANMTGALELLQVAPDEAARVVSHKLDFEGIVDTFRSGPPMGSLKVQLSR